MRHSPTPWYYTNNMVFAKGGDFVAECKADREGYQPSCSSQRYQAGEKIWLAKISFTQTTE